jgi:hypothetical protein
MTRENEKKFLEILGISSSNPSERELDKAYRKLAMKWHPDKWSAKPEAERKAAEEKFKEISVAYDELKNKVKCFGCFQFVCKSDGQEPNRALFVCNDCLRNANRNNASGGNTNQRNNAYTSQPNIHPCPRCGQPTNCCYNCGESAKKYYCSKSTGMHFCQDCYDYWPDCHWCHKKCYGGGGSFLGEEEKFCSQVKNVEQIENVAIPAMEIIREAIKLVANVEILSLADLTIEKEKVSVLLALQKIANIVKNKEFLSKVVAEL